MIEVKNIAKKFGAVQAVRDVGFTTRDGEITTLLGTNGSGKTTTLRCIAGLITPSHGHVCIDGVDVTNEVLRARKKIGFVSDETGLYPRLTAREHLLYYAGFHGLKKIDAQHTVAEIIKTLHLENIADRRTEWFSLGEHAKVALARAMVHQPQNIILDEPTRGLDVLSIRLLRELLINLKEQGRRILFSSHILAEVEQLADKVVIISQGHVMAADTPDMLMKKTRTETLEDAFICLTKEGEKAA